MKVLVASPLRSYTAANEVDAFGDTLGEVLADLDRAYPGIRFRMIDEQNAVRRHMRIFVNGEQVFDLARASPAHRRNPDRPGVEWRVAGYGKQKGPDCSGPFRIRDERMDLEIHPAHAAA